MSLQVEWDNPERSVLLYTAIGAWTWEEFYASRERGRQLADAAPHERIDAIIDLRSGGAIPDNALFHFRRMPAEVHPSSPTAISFWSATTCSYPPCWRFCAASIRTQCEISTSPIQWSKRACCFTAYMNAKQTVPDCLSASLPALILFFEVVDRLRRTDDDQRRADFERLRRTGRDDHLAVGLLDRQNADAVDAAQVGRGDRLPR